MEENNTIGTIVEDAPLDQEIKNKYMDYALEVILERALPKLEDGLKPVQRRILYDMKINGLLSNRPTKKSAATVGDVLGKFHSHGDASVYEALVNLAQDWKQRYPLVYVHGNLGSPDGDPAAAMRYTESRLSKIGEAMLEDLDKNTVKWRPNYDESEQEPCYLSGLFPNILCNPTSGMAVGIATSMAPHYAGDVYKAIDYIIDSILNQKVPDENKIISIVKAPDFPTGGIIINPQDLSKIYKTGNGRITIRSKCNIVLAANKRDNDKIYVTELPYGVNKAKMVAKIADLYLSQNKKLDGISDISDLSNKDGINVVITVKKNTDPNIVLNSLYKYTELQSSFSINNTVIIGDKPKEKASLQEILYYFISHAINVTLKKAQYELEESDKRLNIVQGYIKASTCTEDIINAIKSAETQEDKITNLVNLGFNIGQAKAINNMRLGSLSKLDISAYKKEQEELNKEISYNKNIITNKIFLLKVTKEKLHTIANSSLFKDDKRRTEISYDTIDASDRDLIEEETVVLTYSHNGMIKSVKVDEYNAQNRNGKGVSMKTRDNDFVEQVLTVSSKDDLMLFSKNGLCYTLPVYKIPIVAKTNAGKYINNYVDLKDNDKIQSVLPIQNENKSSDITIVTKNGIIKRMPIDKLTSRQKVVKAITFNEDDSVLSAHLINDKSELFVATVNGLGTKIKLNNIRPIASRAGKGVKLMNFNDNDYLVASAVVSPDKTLAIIATENGKGKKIDTSFIEAKNRGAKGQKIITLDKDDKIASCIQVDDNESFFVTTSGEMIARFNANDIRRLSLSAKGCSLVNLNNNAKVVSMASAPAQQEEESDG